MNNALIHTSSTALMLVCLCTTSTADAGIKPPQEERSIPLTTYEPPGFHTNQGGRNAGSDETFKPDQELTMITLLDILVPYVVPQGTLTESVIPMHEPYRSESWQTSRPTLLQLDGSIGPFNKYNMYRIEGKSQPGKSPALTVVPAPGALVLLLGSGLVHTRRRRRS